MNYRMNTKIDFVCLFWATNVDRFHKKMIHIQTQYRHFPEILIRIGGNNMAIALQQLLLNTNRLKNISVSKNYKVVKLGNQNF